MQKISIVTLCFIVLASAQPQFVTQQPQVISEQPRVVQPTTSKKENERVASPFNVINSMYDVTPLRVKVFNWFSSWFTAPGPIF